MNGEVIGNVDLTNELTKYCDTIDINNLEEKTNNVFWIMFLTLNIILMKHYFIIQS